MSRRDTCLSNANGRPLLTVRELTENGWHVATYELEGDVGSVDSDDFDRGHVRVKCVVREEWGANQAKSRLLWKDYCRQALELAIA